MYIHIHACYSLLRGPKNYATPIAVSLTSALNLVSRCHTSIKETRTLFRMVDSRTGPGKYQMSLEHLMVQETQTTKVKGAC